MKCHHELSVCVWRCPALLQLSLHIPAICDNIFSRYKSISEHLELLSFASLLVYSVPEASTENWELNTVAQTNLNNLHMGKEMNW
jgi:hypothetical protein